MALSFVVGLGLFLFLIQSISAQEGSEPDTESVIAEISDEPVQQDTDDLPDASSEQETTVESPRSQRDMLIADFGIDENLVDDPNALESISEAAAQRLREAEASRIAGEQFLREIRRVTALLERQLANETLPLQARQLILQDLVTNQVDQALQAGENQVHFTVEETQKELQQLATRRSEAMQILLLRSDDDDYFSQLRLDEADRAHQDALRRVADAIRLEQEERNEEIRALLTQERELAEELAELAKQEGDQVRRLDTERRRRAESFAENRSRINAKIVDIPPYPREETAREIVDPLFREVLDTRRRARRQYYEHLSEKQAATLEVKELQDAHQSALSQLRGFQDAGDESERIQRRYAIAQLRTKLVERKLQMARDILGAHLQTSETLRERVLFYHSVVEDLIPRVSREQHAEFFSLRRDENWQDAFDAFRNAADQVRLTVEDRIETVTSLPDRILSVAVLLWIFGLLWRCLLFPVAFFVGREYSPRMVRFVTETLLRRRFFRRHAAFTIKGGEILGAMVKPAMIFIATIVVIEFAAAAWAELYLFRWGINAIFIYWMLMIAVKLLVLPRGYREGDDPDYADDGDDPDSDQPSSQIVDLIKLELSRATKIVISTRVILIFWLLAFYVPALVLHATGHNVVWRIVDRLAVWGLLAVVYVVLSTWRDDISDIFARLASEKMPRSVAFVKAHKHRPWGVLLIGLASVYVTGRELARVGRSYFVETEWNRRLANFFFRKQIELQQRDRVEDDPEFDCGIPDDYRALFADRPLVDESFALERNHLVERIEKNYDQWHLRPRKGVVAVVAEQGLGKTTLLNQVYSRWNALDDRRLSFLQLNDKINDTSEACEFLASFLGIDSIPDDPRALVEKILKIPPRVLIIDDCHHFFLRQIGGFEAIDFFLKIINRTDHHHFWLLSFNSYTWSYLNRVRYRGHFFSEVITIDGWKESEIQDMIRRRNDLDDLPISFTELVVAHDEDRDQNYEIVRTSNGYFRLLHEFSQGNPRVALTFWLRSLRLDSTSTLQVELFRRPSLQILKSLSDDYIFALAAIAQHESLRPDELSTIIHAYHGECEMIVDYLANSDIVQIDPVFQRASIRALFLRSVLKTLQDANVLYS